MHCSCVQSASKSFAVALLTSSTKNLLIGVVLRLCINLIAMLCCHKLTLVRRCSWSLRCL